MKELKKFGIGVDIESIHRFRKLDYLENSSFLKKIFTENELEYCFSNKAAAPHLTARYAAKEAVVKALTSIGRIDFSYKEIEIFNSENGVPLVRINKADVSNLQIYLSLSHCEDKAIAFATVMEVNYYEED